MTAVLVLAMLAQAADRPEIAYAQVSAKHELAAADRLMREGKHLEAAVAYRNALLQPGDREAVRVPFALALFAHGDPSYAGVELRRAHTLYDGFARLKIDATELFGSRAALVKHADRAARETAEGDGAELQAALAYVLHVVGETDLAEAALGRYAQARGEDAFARDLRAMIRKDARRPAAAAPPAPADADPLQRRVQQMPAGGRPEPLRPGEAVRAGVRFNEPAPRPRGEIFEK